MLQPLGPAARQAASPSPAAAAAAAASSGSARSNEVASFSAFSLSASSPALSLSSSSANKRSLRHSRIPRKNDDVDLSYLLEKLPIASSSSTSSSSSSSSSASTSAKPSLKHSRIPRRTDDVDLSYLLEKVPVASSSSASRPSLTDLPPVIPRSYKGHQQNGPSSSSSSTLTLSPAMPTLKPLGKGPDSGSPLLMTGTTIGGFASSSSSSSKTKQALPDANIERINLNNTKTATTAAESETKDKEAGESATEQESLPLMSSSATTALQKGGDKPEDTGGVDRFVSPLSPRQRGLGKGRFGQRTNPSKAFEAPYIENANHKPLSLNNSPSLSSTASTSTPASSSSSATTVTVASWKGQALALLNETQRQILTSSAQEWLKADSLCTNFNFDRRKQERRKFYLQKYAMKSNRRVKASKAIRLEEDKRERDREAAARAAAAAITAANGKEAEGMHASEETGESNNNHYFYGNIKLEGKNVAVVASSSTPSSASSSASSSNAGSPFLMLKEGTRGGKKQKPLFDHNVKKKKKKKKNLEDDPTEVFGGIKGSNIGGLTKSADLSHIKMDFIARARKEVLEKERAAAAKATVEDKKEEEPTTRKRRNTSTKKEEKTKEKQSKEEEFDEPPPLKEKKKKKNKMGFKKKKDASDQTEANDEKHKKKKTKKKDLENSADKISSKEKKKKKKKTKESANDEGKQRETKKRSKVPPLLKSKTQHQLLQSSNDSNDTANSSNGDDNVPKTKSSTVTLCRTRSPNSERLHKEKEADKEEIVKEKNVDEGDESEDEDDTTRKLWFDIEADEYDLLGSKEEEYEPFTSGSKIWTRAKLKLRRASLGSSSYASNSVGWIGRAAAKHNQHKNFNKDRIQKDERRTRSNSISSSPTEKQHNNNIRKNMDELLPMSLWALIVQWLKPMDFLVLSLVSKRFFVLADEALLWKKIHERQWGAFSIVHYTKYGKLFWEEDLDINQWKRAALVREGSLRPTDPSPQYDYNEIFCDIIEHLNVIFSPDGQVKKASLNGALILKCVLSGLPTVHLKFKAKPVQTDVNTSSVSDYEMVLDDLTMHPCVTSADLADQIVSFVPPDCKQFELLKYRILDSTHLNIPFQMAVNSKQGHKNNLPVLELSIELQSLFGNERPSSSFNVADSNTEAKFVIVRTTIPLTSIAASGLPIDATGGKVKVDITNGELLWIFKTFPSLTTHRLTAYLFQGIESFKRGAVYLEWQELRLGTKASPFGVRSISVADRETGNANVPVQSWVCRMVEAESVRVPARLL